jgi:hypothetical protein
LLLAIGLLTLAAAASAPAILIHPDYTAGLRGAAITIVCLVPAALLVGRLGPPDPADLSTRTVGQIQIGVVCGVYVGLALLGLVGLVAWSHVRSNHLHAELAEFAGDNPAVRLASDGYKFDERFNALPVIDQRRIMAGIASDTPALTFMPAPASSQDTPYFATPLAVWVGRELHVAVWMGREFPPPAYKDQGTATAFVRYCVECDELPTVLQNDMFSLRDDHTSLDAMGLHDAGWTDTYRMVSFEGPTLAHRPRFVRVGLQVISDWDGVAFRLTTLATVRLTAVAQ